MGFVRNLIIFFSFSVIVAACGGGNTTISSSALSGTASSDGNNTSAPSGHGSAIGSVLLKWSAPLTRADNTAVSLSAIVAYRLYYGYSETDTSNFIEINDGTATQYTISLPSGSYYFKISAIDTNGNEGLKSLVLHKTL